MAVGSTRQSYGSVARLLHWLTALLIVTAIPLGWQAGNLPQDTASALAAKSQAFSLHNTLGVAAFAVALIRIIWALTQPRPGPLHADRLVETTLADIAYWTLYLSLVLVPLSGWVTHAASDGFAPILWPFGQGLPFVPISNAVASVAGTLHYVFTNILIGVIILHFAGAMKHAIVDMDGTMGRMTSGAMAGPDRVVRHSHWPLALAIAIYLAGVGVALLLL